MEVRAVRGMNDILPEEVGRWQALEAAFRAHAELHGFAEVRTPVIESTELFVRQIGETTDVVEKEMYSFERHDDRLTVRPEGTAGAARAFVEHSVANKTPIARWFYLGPMFRGERPAKGRYRQFWQAGCEHYGDHGPIADAEMIDFVVGFFQRIGITDLTTHVSSLGSGDTHARFRQAVHDFLAPKRASLSEDSQRRLDKNPLRILDSKDARDRDAIVGCPSILDLLEGDDLAHWDGLRRHLDALGVNYVVDTSLVRGLDYYTRTLFEVKTKVGDLGAQNTLAGGGRYDNMIEGLGGPKVPAIGFAMGIERVLSVAPLRAAERKASCYVAPMGDAAASAALVFARDLRRLGVVAEVDGRGGKLKAMLRRAEGSGARACVIFGESELARGVVAVKDLAGRTQDEIPLEGAAAVVADRLAKPAITAADEGAPGDASRGAR
jgi:histidyl-tRNA synthetase